MRKTAEHRCYQAAGWSGMAGGQCLDIEAEERAIVDGAGRITCGKNRCIDPIFLGHWGYCGVDPSDPRLALLSSLAADWSGFSGGRRHTRCDRELGDHGPAGSDEN